MGNLGWSVRSNVLNIPMGTMSGLMVKCLGLFHSPLSVSVSRR